MLWSFPGGQVFFAVEMRGIPYEDGQTDDQGAGGGSRGTYSCRTQPECADGRGASAAGLAGADRWRDGPDPAKTGCQCGFVGAAGTGGNPEVSESVRQRRSWLFVVTTFAHCSECGLYRSGTYEGRVRQHRASGAGDRCRQYRGGGASAQSAG